MMVPSPKLAVPMRLTLPKAAALSDLARSPLQHAGDRWLGARRRHTLHTVAALERNGFAVVFKGPGMAFPTAEGERLAARFRPRPRP